MKELLSEEQIQILKKPKVNKAIKAEIEKMKKRYQVVICNCMMGTIPCAMLTGIGISEWWHSYNLKDGIPEIFKIEKNNDGYYVEIGLEKGDIKDRIEYFISGKNFNKLLDHYIKHGDGIKEVVTNKKIIAMTNGFSNFTKQMFKIVPKAIDKAKKNKQSLNEEERVALIAFKELTDHQAGGSYEAMVSGCAKLIESTGKDKKMFKSFSEKNFKSESIM